jgi:protein transport protein SEC31
LIAPGDRSHIGPDSKPIYDSINGEMQRVKARAPASYRPQVLDTEKRVNLLFDHLNASAIESQVLNDLQGIADAIGRRDHDDAAGRVTRLMTQIPGQQWLVSFLCIYEGPH